MPFDNYTRNRLQKLVSDSKKLLFEEFLAQLQSIYGIQPSGFIAVLSEMPHLDEDQYFNAILLRERIKHLESGIVGIQNPNVVAIERLIREQSFTILNRFAAMRMCEERGIILESLANGFNSKGFKVFQQTAGSALGNTYDKYKNYIDCLYDELSIDLGVLFDKLSPLGLLFPGEKCLEEFIRLLNDKDIAPLWKEDETIGWIYQYFNSKEEREEMRRLSETPRNSRELAVRNQFFTPRYVVQFLTDNTLGRIWYEMTQGNTSLIDYCEYFIKGPNEIFLKKNDITSTHTSGNSSKNKEELLNEPVYIDYRSIKDPRDITMLDPACGSMHFGLYAFDLFEIIYEEAWDNHPELLTDIRQSVSCKEDFLKLIPELIISYNIHGIDIDPRAVQIANLSLWLRAQRYWQEKKIKIKERPQIKKSNVVCAEPMPGELNLLDEFTKYLQPPILGKMVKDIWGKMQLAGEAGILLKIEEEIKDTINNAKEEWRIYKDLKGIQINIFQEGAPYRQEMFEFEMSKVEADFWIEAENNILESLRRFGASINHGESYQRSLFTEDAVKGFTFIDLCRKYYDIILMNPPFGESSDSILDYLNNKYPTWNKNLLCSFIQRSKEKIHNEGFVGVIYDRTAFIKSTYKAFRIANLINNNSLTYVADLGWNVLDANVEVTTSILRKKRLSKESIFYDVREISSNQKNILLRSIIKNFPDAIGKFYLIPDISTFKKLPNYVIGYDFPTFLIKAFNDYPSLEDSNINAYQGHALKSEKHFRFWWEVIPNYLKNSKRLFNGSRYSPYFTDYKDVLYSSINIEDLPTDSSTVFRNKELQEKKGICFGKRGEYFSAHLLPQGHFFTVEGQSIPIDDFDKALEILAFLNTTYVRYTLNKYAGQHKYSGYVNLLPYFQFKRNNEIRENVKKIILLFIKFQSFDETQPFFTSPLQNDSIKETAKLLEDALGNLNKNIKELEEICNNETIDILNINDDEQKILIDYWNNQPKINYGIVTSNLEKYLAHNIISYFIGVLFNRWDKNSIKKVNYSSVSIPFDGLPVMPIAMLHDGNSNNLLCGSDVGILTNNELISCVLSLVESNYAQETNRIEQEILNALDVDSIKEYITNEEYYFAEHLKRYSTGRKLAPIYWSISIPSKEFTIWIYYNKLNDQTLFKCLNNFIEPRILELEKVIDYNSSEYQRNPSIELRLELENLIIQKTELSELKSEMKKVIELPYKPNLSDGVLITAAPLWKMFKHRKWREELKNTWEKLEAGEYDWSHLALSIFPERVKEKCKKDKSLAVSHNLGSLYLEIQKKIKKTNRKK